MYLEHEDWSPRYQDTFYTVRLDHFELFASLPNTTAVDDPPPGKTNFPAYYYKIEIVCGRHDPKVIFRRYSQFKWLYETLPRNITAGSVNDESLSFPPGSSCFCRPQNDEFARNRSEQLREFLREALTRRDVASHDAVALFLELDGFEANTS